MAKTPSVKQITEDLVFYLGGSGESNRFSRLLKTDDIQKLLASDSGLADILTNPTPQFLEDLQQILVNAGIGGTEDLFADIRQAAVNARTSAGGAVVSAADLVDDAPGGMVFPEREGAFGNPSAKPTLGDPSKPVPYTRRPDSLSYEPTSVTGAGRRRGEGREPFRTRVRSRGASSDPTLLMSDREAFGRGLATYDETGRPLPMPKKPRKPYEVDKAPPGPGRKGGFFRDAKAGRLRALRRIPKMGPIAGSLAGIGALLTISELLSNRSERLGAVNRSMAEGLEGYDRIQEDLLSPSTSSQVAESGALRDIAMGGQGSIGLSRELQDIIGVDQRRLLDMRQRVNPSLREAYARAGIL